MTGVYAVVLVASRYGAQNVRCEIVRDGQVVASAVGKGDRDALLNARLALYNSALPEREGHDRAWLARYNARYGTNAPSLHDDKRKKASR